MRYLSITGCLVLLLAGCGGEAETNELRAACDELATEGALQISVDPLGDQPVTAELRVTGRVVHANDFAVHRVTVDGVEAEKKAFNFGQWEASIPQSTLLERRAEDGSIMLDIFAEDTCGKTVEDTITVRLIEPVNALVLDPPGIPGDEAYLPADGKTAALITLRANADAIGARVRLQATEGGAFAGLIGDTVTLLGDGTGDATATVLFTSNAPGEAFITASAQDVVATRSILIAGPPALTPANGQLAPGSALGALVTTAGRLHSCQATSNPELTVTLQGQNIGDSPAIFAKDPPASTVDLTVTAAAALAAPVSVTVTCTDAFAQIGQATYTAAP